jgi:hypothetical protein
MSQRRNAEALLGNDAHSDNEDIGAPKTARKIASLQI